jgi:hypothetical protein
MGLMGNQRGSSNNSNCFGLETTDTCVSWFVSGFVADILQSRFHNLAGI